MPYEEQGSIDGEDMAPGRIRLKLAAQWLVPMLAGRRVLDISSPVGLVAALLSGCGLEVTCVTPRVAVADILTQRFGHAVEVRCSELDAIPLPDKSIGGAVCFGPDLGQVDMDRFVEELGRVLGTDALAAVSPRREHWAITGSRPR